MEHSSGKRALEGDETVHLPRRTSRFPLPRLVERHGESLTITGGKEARLDRPQHGSLETDYLEIERLVEKEPATLEERVARLESVREIHDLLWRYAHLSDRAGMKERLVEEFCTADVEKIHAGTLNQRFHGREACLAGWRAGTLVTTDGRESKPTRPEGTLPPRGWGAGHMNFPLIVRIADDDAHAWVTYYHWLNFPKIIDGNLQLNGHTGTDTFWLVKQDRWRIKKWIVQTDIAYRSDVFDPPA